MAKVCKYDDDLMLEAVIRYSDVQPGKIQAKDLAEWARLNMTGLQGVRDYMFLRPKRAKGKDGKVHDILRPCTAKIRELNESRNSKLHAYVNNVLLQSTDIMEFFKLQRGEQLNVISQTRSFVESLVRENKDLKEKSDYAHGKMIFLQDELDVMTAAMNDLKREHTILLETNKKILKVADKALGKQALESIGIIDGDIDIEKFKQSRTELTKDSFNIRKAISIESLMEGIEFDD